MAESSSSIINADNELAKQLVKLSLQKPTDKLVQLLKQNPGCVNYVYQDCSPLIAAVSKGQLETVRLLLTYGAEVNWVNRKTQSALLFSCKFNHPTIVKLLLQHNADTNACNTQDELTALLTAVKNNHFDVVNILLDHGADTAYITKTKKLNVLMIAARYASVEILKILLSRCPDSSLNEKDCNGCTALFHAIYHNEKENVKTFLDFNVDVDSEDNNGRTALMLALSLSKLDIADLLKNGADLNHTDNDRCDILMLASNQGNHDVVEWILKQGNNYNEASLGEIIAPMRVGYRFNVKEITGSTCSDNKSSLPVAETYPSIYVSNNKNCVTELNTVAFVSTEVNNATELSAQTCTSNNETNIREITTQSKYSNNNANGTVKQQRCKVQLGNKAGFTALHFASMNAYTSIVEMLLNKGADANSKNALGWTPLMLASQSAECIPCLTLLVDKGGADVNFTNVDSWSALKIATYFGHLDVVKFLLSTGAKINCPGDNSFGVLKLASARGHYHIIKLYVTHEDVNQVNDDGITSLMAATIPNKKSSEILKLLIESGAKVNSVDKFGKSALTHACCYGNSEAVEILCASGADVQVLDKWGLNCVMNACKHGHLNVLKKLIDKQKCDVNGDYQVDFNYVLSNAKTDVLFLQENSLDEPVLIESVCACTVAAVCGHRECVEYLLAAQICVTEDMKYLAVEVASKRGFHEIVSVLKSYMLIKSPPSNVESSAKSIVRANCSSSPVNSQQALTFSSKLGDLTNTYVETDSASYHTYCANHQDNNYQHHLDSTCLNVQELAEIVVMADSSSCPGNSQSLLSFSNVDALTNSDVKILHDVSSCANSIMKTDTADIHHTKNHITDSFSMNVRGLADSVVQTHSADRHDSTHPTDCNSTLPTNIGTLLSEVSDQISSLQKCLPENSIQNLFVTINVQNNFNVDKLQSLTLPSLNIDSNLDSCVKSATPSMSVTVNNAQYMAFDNSVINTSPH